jgi:hypothetical protein
MFEVQLNLCGQPSRSANSSAPDYCAYLWASVCSELRASGSWCGIMALYVEWALGLSFFLGRARLCCSAAAAWSFTTLLVHDHASLHRRLLLLACKTGAAAGYTVLYRISVVKYSVLTSPMPSVHGTVSKSHDTLDAGCYCLLPLCHCSRCHCSRCQCCSCVLGDFAHSGIACPEVCCSCINLQ